MYKIKKTNNKINQMKKWVQWVKNKTQQLTVR